MRKLTYFITILALLTEFSLFSNHNAWAGLISVKADGTMDHVTISSAIASAVPGDVIDVWGIITETDIVIDKNLTIQGKGAESTIVQGASSKGTAGGRIFFINPNVTGAITYMTIRYGNIPTYYGGAIWNEGTLTLKNCAVSNNTQKRGPITNRAGATIDIDNCIISNNISTDWGGGIYNYNGMVTIDNSEFSFNNSGNVGAIYNLGSNAGNTASVTMTNSTVTGNIMPGNGAVCNYGDDNATANLTLTNCTISNNTSTNGSGGGIYNIGEQNGTATSIFTNCTVSGNSSTRYGGGAQNMTDGGTASMTLINCTVVDNIADSDDNLFEHRGGGIYTQDADTTLLNTIVANNGRGGGWIDDDLNGSSPGANVTANYSLFEFEESIDLFGANNITGSQPNLNLESLADNGGPTHTHAILNTSSPACNAGANAGVPSTDQRGYARNGTADMGAFEYQGTASQPAFVSAETSENGSQVEVTFSKAMSDPGAKHTQFSVISDDVQNALTGAMLKPDDNKTIVLTLASPVSFSQTVTIAYAAGDVRAVDGTMLASFPQQNVINTAIPHPEITLSLTGSSFDEKDGTATVTAFLSEISGWPVTVNLNFTGTATAGTDYTAPENSIVIPALSPSSSITITGSDDELDEYDETVIIDIASVVNGTESGQQQVKTDIIDDDIEPDVTLVLSHSPFAEQGGKATVSATLSEESGRDVTVNLDFSGVGTLGTDYTASGNSIVIFKGSLSNSITLTGIGDAMNEGNETIIVDIASVVNGTEKEEQQVTAIITDLETIVTLSLSGSPFPENSGKATVTATLSKTTGQDVTVTLSFAGTATINDDYTVSADSILIPAGGTSGNIVITGKDDSFDEPDETVIVNASSVTNATESGEQKVEALISDGEKFPRVSFASATQAGDENIGVMTITAQLSTVSGREVILPFTLGGTASQGSDYTVTPSPLVFPAGSTTQAIILTVHDDSVIETDETIIITMREPVNAVTSGTTEHKATIIDNEATGWIINEILADPNGDANGDGSVNSGKDEFVEIVNKTGADANISGWILSDAYGVRHTFPSGTTVADRCTIVVFGGGNPTGVFGHVTVQTANTGALDLNDSGDTVMLEDSSWTVQAIYVYGPEGGDNQSVTLDPYGETPGIMVKHTTANGSSGALFSPGTEANGMMFSGCNSPPTTTGIGDVTALEDAENASINLWASFADAEDQDSALVYSIINNANAGIFHSVNISENRYLYLDYAENANGSAEITVRATDTRGRFIETTFTAFVIPVNDPPSFVKGGDQVTDELAEEHEQFADNWATSFFTGPGDESDQTILGFEVTNDNNELFLHQPAIDNTGRLSYTPFAYANGSTTVSVSVKDDGGTENSGKDTSPTQTFFITINSIDYPPGISELPDQSADDSETIGPLDFTIYDGDTPSDKLILSVNSSNPALTPENGIVLDGSGGNWTITVTPTLNMGGESIITIIVTDESANSARSAFTVSITKGPVIESDMSAALHNDIDNNGTASPGDTLRYTTIISNTGDRDAEGLMFINTIPISTVLTGTVSADRGTLG